MVKRILLFAPLFLAIFFLQTSCESTDKQDKIQPIDQSEVMVEVVPFAEVQDYVDIIRELDEYKKNLPNQAKTEFVFSFDVRKMTISDSVYYHLELWKTRLARMEESTIPTPEIRAYFRIIPKTKHILILDKKTKQFIDLDDKNGKDCLSKCMTNQ